MKPYFVKYIVSRNCIERVNILIIEAVDTNYTIIYFVTIFDHKKIVIVCATAMFVAESCSALII